MMYRVILSRQGVKDAELLRAAGLLKKAKTLLDTVAQDPFSNPPPYEKLVGNLNGFYARRINIHHRLVYRVVQEEKTVHVLRMWSHYE